MKKTLCLFLSMLLLLSVVACSDSEVDTNDHNIDETVNSVDDENSEESKGVVKIGLFIPLTGDRAYQGNRTKAAAELAIRDWKETKGLCGGYEVELAVYDDKNSPEEAASIAEILVSDEDVMGAMGSQSSGTTMSATPIFQEYGLVCLSNTSSHTDYTKTGDYIFRNNCINAQEAEAAMDMVKKIINPTTVGIIYSMNDWGVNVFNYMEDKLPETGMTLGCAEPVVDNTDDFGTAIANFRAAGCEVIFVAATPDISSPFINQYRALDENVQFAGFINSYDEQLISLAGENCEGMLVPATWFNWSELDQRQYDFTEEYFEYYGEEPTSLAVQAYDCVGMFLEAIDNVGKDRKAIRDYIDNIEYDGVQCVLTFNDTRDASKTFDWAKVENGEFVQIDKSQYE